MPTRLTDKEIKQKAKLDVEYHKLMREESRQRTLDAIKKREVQKAYEQYLEDNRIFTTDNNPELKEKPKQYGLPKLEDELLKTNMILTKENDDLKKEVEKLKEAVSKASEERNEAKKKEKEEEEERKRIKRERLENEKRAKEEAARKVEEERIAKENERKRKEAERRVLQLSKHSELEQMKEISKEIGDVKQEINGNISIIEWLETNHQDWIEAYSNENEGKRAIWQGRVTDGFHTFMAAHGYRIGD